MPSPIPIRLLMNRKLALAVARMLGGTMCWMAAMTGPSQASASICPIANRIQAIGSDGAITPTAKQGAAIRKEMAGISA
jgi:hypothetical protein